MQKKNSSFYTWLHLSDIHMGCGGDDIRRQVDTEFKPHLQEMVKQLGAPDMILMTGDLAFSGQEREYKQLDQFLTKITEWIHDIRHDAPKPLLVPVPGNHDLARPHKDDLTVDFSILQQIADGKESARHSLGQRFFGKNNVQLIAPLFQAYQDWFARTVMPGLQRQGVTYHLSHFPGDWSLECVLPGRFPLRLVGLNSAWMHLSDSFAHEKMELFTQQLHSSLKEDSDLEWTHGHALLLLHHPPLVWFSTQAGKRFKEEIYPPERFQASLFGHMHDDNTTVIREAGGRPRYYLQAPSLFGVEKLGTTEEIRQFGYGWGRITEDGEIFIWPFLRHEQGGQQRFVWNPKFSGDSENGHPFRTRLLEASTVSSTPSVDLSLWLIALRDRTQHIKISGISSGAGHGKNAILYPIEELYTVLKCRVAKERGDLVNSLDNEKTMLFEGAFRDEEINLAEVLPRHARLFIEGQPGSGKSTFLQLVAAMLAKDLLQEGCPKGGTWQQFPPTKDVLVVLHCTILKSITRRKSITIAKKTFNSIFTTGHFFRKKIGSG